VRTSLEYGDTLLGGLPAWAAIAETSLGCAWPSVETAIPDKASRYSLPSVSVIRLPCPWLKATGNRA